MNYIVEHVSLNHEETKTAGKFASTVQKYCWPLNTKCSWHIIYEIQIGFRGAQNLVSSTSDLQFCSQFFIDISKGLI